jgi:hypothetical protein
MENTLAVNHSEGCVINLFEVDGCRPLAIVNSLVC